MAVKHPNFCSLAETEPADCYSIESADRGTSVVIAAPHGGGIEPGTSEICRAIAGEDLSYYLFEGHKVTGNRDLHITSARFDEPQCLSLLRSAEVVVTIHGERSDEPIAYLGGLHLDLGALIRTALTQRGFVVDEHHSPYLQGHDPQNICNIGRTGKGVQLELSSGLRERFFESLKPAGRRRPRPALFEFSEAVREAISMISDHAP